MAKTGKKQQKVQMPAGIRNKLMAAVSMLMVSCIMLVSSTYAWFTLSTAPEITGITTNVGANGNLEMMLLNETSYASTYDNLGVESKVGDSMAVKSVLEANETWGNLVDLYPTSYEKDPYGLSDITLLPSKLSITSDAKTVKNNVLMVPTYGKDGRVISVNNPTMMGAYENSTWTYDDGAVGVRALGTSSGTTVRLTEYRTAAGNVATYASNARLTAQTSLNNNAQALADILIKNAQGTATYDTSDVDTINTIITGVRSANKDIERMIRNALLAYALSAKAGTSISDTAVGVIKNYILDETVELNTMIEGLDSITVTGEDAISVEVPSTLTKTINMYNAIEDALAESEDYVSKIPATGITWDDHIKPALSPLVDQEYVTVSGTYVSEGKNAIVSAVFADLADGNRIPIVMQKGEDGDAGVYYKIAEICESYSVNNTVRIDLEQSGEGGLSIHQDVKFTMTQNVTDDIHVTVIRNDIQTNAGEPEVDLGGGNAIALSDNYGYMLDFGFRTNAAGSKLLLQSDARQRVYTSGEVSDTTQGSGSYMKFTTTNEVTFSTNEMLGLMSAIRVAFVEPVIVDGVSTYTMLALGAFEIESTENNGYITYSCEDATISDSDNDNTNDTVSIPLKLFTYEYDSANDTIKKLSVKQNAAGEDDFEIKSLDQNIASKVSVIVYLDGTIVDNTMVANAINSMTGSLNLQFSSDATLVPMENKRLRNLEDESGATYRALTSSDNKTFSTDIGTTRYTVTVTDGYTIYQKGDQYYYSADSDSTNYTKISTFATCEAYTVTTETIQSGSEGNIAAALSATELSLTAGATSTLTISGLEENTVVAWESSNTAVATVSEAQSTVGTDGTATITITVAANATENTTATITVTPTGGDAKSCSVTVVAE